VVHEPVLRLAVGIAETLRRHVGGEGRGDGEHGGAREQQPAKAMVLRMHGFFLLDGFAKSYSRP
jgi:hypothetical protein